MKPPSTASSFLLSAREWAVLEPLLARPDVVLSRTQLEKKLFSWKHDISSNSVEVYIHGVRKMLGNDIIQTVRGLGYLVPKEWRPNKTVHPIHPQRTSCAAGTVVFTVFNLAGGGVAGHRRLPRCLKAGRRHF